MDIHRKWTNISKMTTPADDAGITANIVKVTNRLPRSSFEFRSAHTAGIWGGRR